jgi:hypothetical protein
MHAKNSRDNQKIHALNTEPSEQRRHKTPTPPAQQSSGFARV